MNISPTRRRNPLAALVIALIVFLGSLGGLGAVAATSASHPATISAPGHTADNPAPTPTPTPIPCPPGQNCTGGNWGPNIW